MKKLKIQHLVYPVLLLVFIIINGQPISDTDTWWHLKVGEHIWQSADVPQSDIFSFSNAGHRWIAHEWLSEVVYYLAYQSAGFQGLFIVNILTLSAIFFFYSKLVQLRGGRDVTVTAGILLICAFFTYFFWVFRPHLFSHLLFIVFLYLLESFWEGKDRVWVLPILMILWVNAHGSFIMGPVLIIIYLAAGSLTINQRSFQRRQWAPHEKKKLALILLMSICAILVNPNTFHILTYPFETLNSSYITDQINEWASPDFHEPYLLFFLVYMLTLFLTAALGFRKHRLSDVLLVGLLSAMSFYAVRNIPLFMYVSGPVYAYYLTGALRKNRDPKQIPALNWILLISCIAAMVFYWPSQAAVEKYADSKSLPVEAVNYLKDHNLNGKVFNDYNWGGYLLWMNYPGNKVMIDGRTDIYADKVYPDYLKIIKLKKGAYQLLKKYNPDVILIRQGSPLDTYISEKEEWKQVYNDSLAVIYIPVR